ncbi:uncharacterized protein [Narcine bancroftii]|uniref:uncharacterized protein n=1 Tax=Narcine bancroftii TaxID=1343680 RepID=UPI003831B427
MCELHGRPRVLVDASHSATPLQHLGTIAAQPKRVLEEKHGNLLLVNKDQETPDHQERGIHRITGQEAEHDALVIRLQRIEFVEPENRNGERDEIDGGDRVLEVHAGDLARQHQLHESEAVQEVQAGPAVVVLGSVAGVAAQVFGHRVQQRVEQGDGRHDHDLKTRGAQGNFQLDQVEDGGLQDQHHFGRAGDDIDEPGQVNDPQTSRYSGCVTEFITWRSGPIVRTDFTAVQRYC